MSLLTLILLVNTFNTNLLKDIYVFLKTWEYRSWIWNSWNIHCRLLYNLYNSNQKYNDHFRYNMFKINFKIFLQNPVHSHRLLCLGECQFFTFCSFSQRHYPLLLVFFYNPPSVQIQLLLALSYTRARTHTHKNTHTYTQDLAVFHDLHQYYHF